MKSIHHWLEEYGESHRHPTNKLLHWVCVPLIAFSSLGMLWCMPFPLPAGFLSEELTPILNWASLFTLAALLFYLRLSWTLFAGMTLLASISLATIPMIESVSPIPTSLIAGLLFVIAWIGQFVGHRIEGKKPSFFQDLQFLLIAPAWLLASVYRKLKVPV